jgi:septal ring factor EnvC (AmiA/AmiB activator)
VLGTATAVHYSIVVSATYGTSASERLETSIKTAKAFQTRLPECTLEIDELQEGLRLTERKLKVVTKMVEEAEEELVRCEQEMR